jgi:hypothetical protein
MRCGIAALDPGAAIDVTVVMTPTVADEGTVTTSASVSAAQRELTPGDNRQTVITPIRAVLSGRVFLDGNGDGARQPWETRGVAGAWLLLEQVGQPIAFTSSEGSAGAFHFDTLPTGSYSLIAELPQGYQLTTPSPVDLAVASDREQVVYFGAWTGEVVPPPGHLHLPLLFGK